LQLDELEPIRTFWQLLDISFALRLGRDPVLRFENKAGLPHCSAHGLRKAGATIAAGNGATEEQLKAIFGWRSALSIYTKKARQERIADSAMHLIVPGHDENKSVPLSVSKSVPPKKKRTKSDS
jgi:hypothetical protein